MATPTGWRSGSRNPQPVITVDEAGDYAAGGGGVTAEYNATPPTVVDTETTPLQTDVNGRLLVSTDVSGYTEDGAAAANPVGGVQILVRKDTPASEVTTDGDNVAQRGTAFGSAYFTGLDVNGAVWDILTPPSVTLLQERTLPTTRWSYAAATAGILNTTTAVTFKAADAALSNYITSIQISAEALTTATEVAIRDGAAGTVLWRTKIGTGGLVGGREINFGTPLKGTAATLLEVVTLTASGAGAVYVNAQGFVAA